MAFDLAASIADGEPWFNCRVTAAPVVYVALEGEAGFKLRAKAWELHHGRSLPDDLHMVMQPFTLTDDPRDVTDLSAVVPAGAAVFIDTLNRAAPTANENDSADMGGILQAAKRLQSLTAGLVVLVHHSGKDATKGLRGHRHRRIGQRHHPRRPAHSRAPASEPWPCWRTSSTSG